MDDATFFRQRDELARRDLAACRMFPPRQRLHSDDLAVDPRQRLVDDRHLALVESGAQILRKGAPFAQALIHLRLEEAEGVTTLGLRPLERGIGVAQQRGRVQTVKRIDGDADAQPDSQPWPSIWKSVATAASRRSASRAAWVGTGVSLTIRANSSPPMRLRNAPSTEELSRSATARNRRSPNE